MYPKAEWTVEAARDAAAEPVGEVREDAERLVAKEVSRVVKEDSEATAAPMVGG
jgi:hypothetical protein